MIIICLFLKGALLIAAPILCMREYDKQRKFEREAYEQWLKEPKETRREHWLC
jgi:hypothetical protein